jgi:RND family efflux transporter MFP subunit
MTPRPLRLLFPVALFGLLLASSCKPPGAPAAPGGGKRQATNVEVWVIRTLDLAERVELPGILQPDLSVTLSAEVAGVVKKVNVRAGDEVRAGDPLVQLAKDDYLEMRKGAGYQVEALKAQLRDVELGAREEQIRQAEAGVSAAKSALALARTTRDRRKALVDAKVLPAEVLDQMQGQVDQAQAGYDRAKEILELARKGAREETKEALRAQIRAAESQVALLNLSIRKTGITSPITGVIQKRFIDPDEFAGPGMPLFEIIQKSPLNLTLGVPERIFTRLSEMDAVTVRFKALRARLDAAISRLAFSADRMTQTFEVEISLANPAQVLVDEPGSPDPVQKSLLLRPGLIGEITFLLGWHRDAVAIPVRALVMEGANLFVYVEEAGKVRTRPVRLGLKQDGMLEVTEGLAAGERLIVAGQKYVRDGDEVKVVAEHTGEMPR